ncbi:MAG: hypothetical protein P1P80_08665 [ANME-2 cluster archaeon]|nr:hypothetical protein [ANME-2 cluster archaeon]
MNSIKENGCVKTKHRISINKIKNFFFRTLPHFHPMILESMDS